MKNDGSASEELFRKRMEGFYGNKRLFIERWPDTKKASKGGKIKGVVLDAAPADFVMTLDGSMSFVEVKSCSGGTSFSFSQFTVSQNRAMTRQAAAGGLYWVAIHNLQTQKWYWVPGALILKTKETKQSLKWAELQQYEWTHE